MKQTGQQSDIGEIIRRLRGGKDLPPETPLARTAHVKVDLAPEPVPQHITPPAPVEKVHSPKDLALFKEEKAVQSTKAETALLEKELISYRKKETSLLAENESLRKEIKSLAEKGNDSFASHVRIFEEKLLQISLEKDVVFKEATSLKSLLEETREKLDQTTILLKEAEANLAIESQNLSAKNIDLLDLSKEKERLAQREEALLTQISLLNGALAEEKQHKEIISLSVKTNQDHINELRNEIEHLHSLAQEKEKKILLLQQEKEKGETRVREVEELLVLKLASISELEEELTSTGARAEDLEAKVSSQGREITQYIEIHDKQQAALSTLHDEAEELKRRLTRANEHIVELRSRIESLDRIKSMMTEATQHVHALADLFGPTPQSLPSLRNLVESFVVKTAGKRLTYGSEESVDQPELF